jgi:DNA modification methylase/superfamily II DNA or RNA helicase
MARESLPKDRAIGDYQSFLSRKILKARAAGFEVSGSDIHSVLYDFQAAIVRWALRRGRAAVFADCGLGKTLIQLEWARHIQGTRLIVAPLSVAEQTAREARKLGMEVRKVRRGSDLRPGVQVTNYEMIRHFVGTELDAIVLDESSILKSIDGKTRKLLLDRFTDIPYRLCCTATPCPNDIAELANHAQFLGVMRREEMLASFFVHDQDGWRMRGHARVPFYRWMASWAMALKSPSDLGYDGSNFTLPDLTIHDVVVSTDWRRPGMLFPGGLKGIVDRADVRRRSVTDRVEASKMLALDNGRQSIVWCGLNAEQDAIAKALGDDCVSIHGAMEPERKLELLDRWFRRDAQILVTKPSVLGFGMNFQNASRMVFLGLGDSYESYYQCIRRCWRYGQSEPVEAHVVVTDHEAEIVENVRRKESQAETLTREIIEEARMFEIEEIKNMDHGEVIGRAEYSGEGWELHQGDCVEEMKIIGDESIDLSVFSPPFLALYTYSSTERDLGNSRTEEEFFGHFGFVMDELFRVTKPGRLACVHVAQVPALLVRDGFIGMKDFRGKTIDAFISKSWIYQGEVCIDKDPQAQAIRTHSKGLLFTQLKKDSSWLRPALADYILVFRKPGDNSVPIKPDINNEQWIEWARPIWYGIRESDTLNAAEARSEEDDRHVCPLQLGTIERCIRLWSNRGETVLSPFAGIGSEGYVALQFGRRFIGCELKPLYAKTAAKNLRAAGELAAQPTLFDSEAR